MRHHAPTIAMAFSLTALAAGCGSSKSGGVCDSAEGATTSSCSSTTSGSTVSSGGGGTTWVGQDLPPLPGAGPSYKDIAWNGYTVTWPAATDDRDKAEVLQYQLVAAAKPADLATVQQALAAPAAAIELAWKANTLTATVTGRAQNEPRTYAVLVRDSAGNVAVTAATVATTTAEPAPVPGSAIVTSPAAGGLTDITWGAAVAPGDASLSYLMVFDGSADAIDTVAKAEANAAGSNTPWLPPGALDVQVSGHHGEYVAVVVKNSAGLEALYTPVAVP